MTNSLEKAEVKEIESAISDCQFLDMKSAAKFLSISLSSIQKISSSRLIPVYKPRNGKVYFLKSDLINYVAAGKRKSYFEIQQETFEKEGGNHVQ